MRNRTLALLASTSLAAGLGLADTVTSAQAQTPTWTGLYFGAHAGYRWADSGLTSDPFSFDRGSPGRPFNISGRSENFGSHGGAFGLQGGYNHQFAVNWLVGIEASISLGKLRATHTFSTTDGFTTLTFTRNSTLTLGPESSIRGRFGYVVSSWLMYVAGGISFARAGWSESWAPVTTLLGPPLPFAVSTSKTLTGWTFGGGIEHTLTRNVLVRLEYLYTDFGTVIVPLALTTTAGTIDVSSQVVRAGISYKFAPY